MLLVFSQNFIYWILSSALYVRFEVALGITGYTTVYVRPHSGETEAELWRTGSRHK